MENKRIDELSENYEDALMALLMDEYAEANGAQLLKEYEEEERSGAIPDIPEALDKKCRDLIRRSYAKHRFRVRLRTVAGISKRVALITLAALGLCSVLIVSVEAIRTPVIRFFIEQNEEFSSIDFDTVGSNTESSDPIEAADESQPVDRSISPLVGMVPDGYELVHFSDKGKRGFTCLYKDDADNIISFSATPAKGRLNVDTEDAIVEDIELLGHDGMLILKADDKKIVWLDEAVSICYQLRATELEQGELWALAETVATCPEWANLISGG